MLSAARCLSRIGFQRSVHTSTKSMGSIRVAVIGQSNFGAEVYKSVREKGHEIVGVFTVPDVQVSSWMLSFVIWFGLM